MPTIEKLLSSDWKERLLGRNTAESKEVKGEVTHLHHRPSCHPPRARAAWAGNRNWKRFVSHLSRKGGVPAGVCIP